MGVAPPAKNSVGKSAKFSVHMKLTAVKYYCSDLGNPPQRTFAITASVNRVIFFTYSES